MFFSVRSVALIDDIPSGLSETQGYKSSAKFVLFKKNRYLFIDGFYKTVVFLLNILEDRGKRKLAK